MKKEAETKRKSAVKNTKTTWIETLEQQRADGKSWIFIWGYDAGTIDDDFSRVYLDASLHQAIDIPKDAILHSQESETTNLLGGIYVWVDQEQWGKCRYRYTS